MTRGSDTREELQLRVWLEEYRAMSTDIGNRIELQHRNVSLAIIVLTAITGYLVNYWSNHSLDALVSSEIATLIAIGPLVASIFLWRHIDHDANIIDKADYIEAVVRPNVGTIAGDDNLLGFERFLRHRRVKRRPWAIGPMVILLGTEHAILLLYFGVYLACGWYVRVSVSDRAGEAEALFDTLLYIGSGLLGVSAFMLVGIGLMYSTLGRATPEEGGDVSDPEAESKDPEKQRLRNEQERD